MNPDQRAFTGDSAIADTAPADIGPVDDHVHDSSNQDTSVQHPDLTVGQAVASLQFIVAGLQTHPNPTSSDAPDPSQPTSAAAADLPDLTAELGLDRGVNRDRATRLIEALLAAAMPLRDDQARGIVDAGNTLGVPPAILKRLEQDPGRAAQPFTEP